MEENKDAGKTEVTETEDNEGLVLTRNPDGTINPPGEESTFDKELDEMVGENEVPMTDKEVSEVIEKEGYDPVGNPERTYKEDVLYRELDCVLTHDEKITIVKELSDLYKLLRAQEEELKTLTNRQKVRIKSTEEEVREKAYMINTGIEVRSVECKKVKDYYYGTHEVIRIDTGEVIESRNLTSEERQRPLL